MRHRNALAFVTLRIVPPIGGCVIQTFRFSWKLSPESHLKPPEKGASSKALCEPPACMGKLRQFSRFVSVSLARWLALLEP